MKTALLVIDLLQDFFFEGRLLEHKETLIKNTNELVAFARSKKIPIIWVRQEYKADLSDAPLYNKKTQNFVTIENTPGCQLLEGLDKNEDDYEIVKKRYSAFYKTNLEDLLNKLGVTRIIMAGVNTMTCVRTAAIDAYQRDFEVILALDCVDGHDEEQHKCSLKYLSYAVAQELTNEEIFKKV